MKRITSCFLASVLVIGVVAQTASAQRVDETGAPGVIAEITTANLSSSAVASQNEKLKADVAKLIAETKAGNRSVVPRAQVSSPQRNNLSKKAKIGIAVAVVVIVVTIVAVKSFKYECKSRCVL